MGLSTYDKIKMMNLEIMNRGDFMEQLKKYTLEVSLATLGLALFVIGLFFGAQVIVFNLDGFYFFIAGLLLMIYGVGTIISKVREEQKTNKKESD